MPGNAAAGVEFIPGLPLKAFRFALLACSQKAKRRHDSLVASSATGRAPALSLSASLRSAAPPVGEPWGGWSLGQGAAIVRFSLESVNQYPHRPPETLD